MAKADLTLKIRLDVTEAIEKFAAMHDTYQALADAALAGMQALREMQDDPEPVIREVIDAGAEAFKSAGGSGVVFE